ncbi:hypothetical protein QR680_001771 [Steinernema hermaphroditum]|uniref:Uncharacterized protein n=1 Tax=Steinernema hermaphroditum TaxID=289476 RepID=A0AA39GZS0_9BILA|nr:hypothetical protein QR680_001771 [Steinernema hermaphroditum]
MEVEDERNNDTVQAVRTRPPTSYTNAAAEEHLENVDLVNEPELLPLVPAPRDVTGLQMIGYGIGHFYNDLCASMWFTYLMIYLEKGLKLHSSSAGFLMLVGQVTDAVATPLVGILSDHSTLPHCSNRFGRRLSWHFLGTVLVTFSFPFVFNTCLPCTTGSWEGWTVLWFVPFIMIFQIGWAAVQISHLSLMVDLSSVESSRTSMNAIRYGSSVVANVFVFALFAVLLKDVEGTSVIGPQDAHSFRNAGFVVVGLGLIVSVAFYAAIKEPRSTGRSRLNSLSSEISERMYWSSWFKHIQFYQIAFLYMFARLFINVSQVYFPFYATLTQDLTKQYVAILPMVSFISSFVITVLLSVPFVNKLFGHKILCTAAAVFGTATCGWMFLDADLLQMYGISVLLGICRTAFLVSSLGMTANMINRSTESGAFVYGGMSFLDKLSNGIAYQIIELLNPSCDGVHKHETCASFYRNVMTFVPGGCAVLFLFVLLTLIPSQIGKRIRRRRRDDDMEALVNEHHEETEG